MKIWIFMLVVALVLPAAVSADAPSQENSCASPPAERKPNPQVIQKKVDSQPQQIVVHCGTVSVAQPAGELLNAVAYKPVGISGSSNDSTVQQSDKTIEAYSKLISSIAWPLVGIFVAFLFRVEFSALFARLRRGKFGSAEFEFDPSIKKVTTLAEEASSLPRFEENSGHRSLSDNREGAYILARSNPSAAIIDTWARLEVAIGQGLHNANVITDGEKMRAEYDAVKGAEVLFSNSPRFLEYFNGLRNLRNKLVHGKLPDIGHKAACNFIELAFRLMLLIENRWPNRA